MKRARSLAAYGFVHFCVDFACFFVLFHKVKPGAPDLAAASLDFLTYNVIAFGLQPLIGYACDRYRAFPAGRLGCLLVAVGAAAPWRRGAMILCALGNALFHVEGGIESLREADGKLARSGLFVSTGALGVVFGTFAGQRWTAGAPAALLMVACFVLLRKKPEGNMGKSRFDTASALPYEAVLFLALVSVVIRSFAGGYFPLAWKTTAAQALLLGAASFCGKAAGGFLADRLGPRLVGALSLAASLPLLLLGNGVPALSLMGAALFNMTMPITLCAVASKLPDNPGFAFGLCSLALLLGNIPTFFLPDLGKGLFLLIPIVISSICISICIKGNPRTRF